MNEPPSTISLVSKADLDRLMTYHDQQFVVLAYRLLLGREPDPDGLGGNLAALRRGESRREVAYRVATSEEARSRGLNQDLFGSYRTWRRIERTPVVGSLALLLLCIFRVKKIVREVRRLQNAIYGGYAVSSEGSGG